MITTLAGQIGAMITILVAAFAFLKGDDSERVGAGAYLIAWLASLLLQNNNDLYGVPLGVFAIDVVVLIVFIGLAWKAQRVWPYWAGGFQLLAVSSHVLGMIDMRATLASFITVLNLTSYGVLATLAIGTFWAWQERRAAGLE